MKEKIKIIIILVLVSVLFGIGIWCFQHQKKVNYCKEECVYIEPKEPDSSILGRLIGKGDYWRIGEYPNYRNFQTQNQCVDYCLNVK